MPDPHAAASVRPSKAWPRLSLSALAAGLGIGVVATLVLILLFLILIGPVPSPPLTTERLSQAWNLWEQHKPAHYLLVVQVDGLAQGTYEIEVKNELAIRGTLNGRPIPARVWERWTVGGLFDVLEEDLSVAATPEKIFPQAHGADLHQQAGFDPALGYPRHYQRRLLGANVSYDLEWRIERFESLP